MKTAISIPDEVFQEAERLATELGQSRSHLYSQAIREYVARHAPDRVTAGLNEIHEGVPDEAESRFLGAAARRTLEGSEW